METILPPALPWSTRLTFSAAPATLTGDKILLPSSALEQLLSAATTAAATTEASHDPESWAAPPTHRSEREHLLPQPMIVRLSTGSGEKRRSVHAVPREFSAEEGEVVVSGYLAEALGLSSVEMAGKVVDVEAATLPKGTRLRLRPLEAGYEEEDWKAILEAFVRKEGFATLEEGVILSVPRGVGSKGSWRFLVDEAVPGGSVCLIDTDVEVAIEPLSEEQARETLQRRQQRKTAGGKIKLDAPSAGELLPGEYHFYDIDAWDKSGALVVELEVDGADEDEGADVDIFVTTDKQHHKPRIEEHIWGDMGNDSLKRITISPGNIAVQEANRVSIGVRAWQDPDAKEEDGAETASTLRRYTLRVTQAASAAKAGEDGPIDDARPSADHQRCKNCQRWIPARTMMLHENFCLRNNYHCAVCDSVFQRNSPSHLQHWHCEHCTARGNSTASHDKHSLVVHTPRACPTCTYAATSLPDLASHRTTTCPGALHICRFCHLLVPRGGTGDGSQPSAEQILTGLSAHELDCGARTTECESCARRIRLRDLNIHQKQHELSRLSRPRPRTCRNPNCTRPRGNPTTALGLCESCFGPLHASGYDPTGAALRRRAERRLLSQMLVGCNREWCRNELCRTGRANRGLTPVAGGTAAALPLVRPVVERLQDEDAPIAICVDEQTQGRRELAEALRAESVVTGQASGRGAFPLEFCLKAVEEGRGSVEAAKRWLDREAVREGER